MVWKGTAMEVLETTKKKKINSSTKNNKLSEEKFSIFTDLLLAACSSDTSHLSLVRLHHFKEKVDLRLDIPIQGGWFKFLVFNLTAEAKPMEGVGAKVFIEASILYRQWLQIMDDQTASSFRTWKDDILKAHYPPYSCDLGTQGFGFFPIDLCSPQVLTQAWLVVKDHNYKQGADLEFLKVVKAEYGPCTGETYYLTFEAREHGTVSTFQVVVYEIAFINCWKPVTLLRPCKMEDEYELPELWKSTSICKK